MTCERPLNIPFNNTLSGRILEREKEGGRRKREGGEKEGGGEREREIEEK